MALLPNLDALLNNALAQAARPATYTSGVRNAMIFTSRLRKSATDFSPTPLLQAFVGPAASALFNASQLASVVNGDFFQGSRSGLQPEVIMGINPNTVRFKQPKRFSKKDTREGSVFFHFTNSKGQNNDILTMEFVGNTGNIDTRGSQLTQQEKDLAAQKGIALNSPPNDPGAIAKIAAWHNLMLLTREPMLLSDNTENVFSITYLSALFPQAIQFNGFYNQVLEFEENARKPNSRDYRFEFTVTSTHPSLDELLDLVLTALQQAVLTPAAGATVIGSNAGAVSP